MPDEDKPPCRYDYGTGGVWALVSANSEADILKKYPELRVVHKRPTWMNEDAYQDIRTKMSFDLESPSGWLLEFQQKRN